MPSGSAPGERRGGRQKGTPNKKTAELSEIAGKYTAAAVEELGRLAVSATSEQARVGAIKELLDRAYGKAVQRNEQSGPNGGPIQMDVNVKFVGKSDTSSG